MSFKHRAVKQDGIDFDVFNLHEATCTVDLSGLSWAEGSDGDAGKWLADVDASDLDLGNIKIAFAYAFQATIEGADSTEMVVRAGESDLATIDLETAGDRQEVYLAASTAASGTAFTLVLDGGTDDDPTGGVLTCTALGIRVA